MFLVDGVFSIGVVSRPTYFQQKIELLENIQLIVLYNSK